MILEIKYKNMGPFKDTALISFIPNEYGGKLDNVIYEANTGHNVLNIALIYGKNSAGKTNIVKPLYALKSLLTNPIAQGLGTGILYNPYTLDTETESAPSMISIRFTCQGEEYLYAIEYNVIEILQEKLQKIQNGENIPMFSRTGKNKASHNVIFYDRWNSNTRQTEVFRNQLALALYLNTPNDEVGTVSRYIRDIQVGNGYNHFMRDHLWKEVQAWLAIDSSNRKRRLTEFLRALDVRLESLKTPSKPDAPFYDNLFVHKMYDNGEPTDKDKYLDMRMESQGSRWLFLLCAKIMESLDNGYPLFLDELDSCFHTQVTEFIMELYRNPAINKNNAQLMLTTHNVLLMNEKKLRRDQIWLVEKERDISEIYSLSDFNELHEDIDFSKWYLANRFGGTPNIGSFYKVFNY